MTPQQQFAEKVRQLVAQSRALAPAARRTVLELLEEARKRVVGEISALDPASFQAAQLNALKLSIDRAMAEFARQASSGIQSLQAKAFQLGGASASEPLAAAGLESSILGSVSRSTLSIAQGYTADLVTALSIQAAAQVNAAIQRAFLGGQPLGEIIAQVGRAINEILRVQSIAAQARLEDLASRHPDLRKMWKHIPAARVPRPSHIVADGQVVEVAEPYLVDGEELMYPRDPAGSPENTINCHCLSVPYFDEDALQPSAAQKGLLAGLGISIGT